MRFLYPSADTKPTSRRDWATQAQSLLSREWCARTQILAEDKSSQEPIDLLPCRLFAKLRRFNPGAICPMDGTILTTGRNDKDSLPRWKRANKWSGLPMFACPNNALWPTRSAVSTDPSELSENVRSLALWYGCGFRNIENKRATP